MTQLFSFTMPTTVPPEWAGLQPGKPSYVAIGDGVEFVTQLQDYITKYSIQQFGNVPIGERIVETNPNEALRLFKDSVAARSGPSGGSVPSDLAPVVAAINAGFDRLESAVTALPAEIDRYSDGKKQS